MKYWDEFHDKYGFGDGEAVPPDAWALRYVYVREINRIAESLGSAIRLFAYDRPGIHNPYLISRVAAATVSDVPGKALCKGLYRAGWDPGLNYAEPPTDDTLEAAISAAMTMELEDLVKVEVAIKGRPRARGTARRHAA
jgi:hypothetical protein